MRQAGCRALALALLLALGPALAAEAGSTGHAAAGDSDPTAVAIADGESAGPAQAGAVPPATAPAAARGLASWYGVAFHGRKTASGERFDMDALTAAHPTLPFGTVVEVRSLANGRTVRVRINDRGPFGGRRIIDLSRGAAQALGLVGRGVKRVELRIVEDPGGQRSS